MLGDFSRGASWTNALLNTGKEIHVCVELRTIGLLEKNMQNIKVKS